MKRMLEKVLTVTSASWNEWDNCRELWLCEQMLEWWLAVGDKMKSNFAPLMKVCSDFVFNSCSFVSNQKNVEQTKSAIKTNAYIHVCMCVWMRMWGYLYKNSCQLKHIEVKETKRTSEKAYIIHIYTWYICGWTSTCEVGGVGEKL